MYSTKARTGQTTWVSRSDPTIKAILAATIGLGWQGRDISVIEQPRGWQHTEYLDDRAHVWYLTLRTLPSVKGSTGLRIRRLPSIGFYVPTRMHDLPNAGEALVIEDQTMGARSVEIVVPQGAIDPGALSVAEDVLQQPGKGAKKRAAVILEQCGDYAGLAMAMATAHTTMLKKAAGPGLGTKHSQRQLEREIQMFLERR